MLPVLCGIVSAVLLGACEEFDDYCAANAAEGHPNSSDTPALSAEDCFFYTYRALEGRCHKKRDVIKRAPNQFWDMAPELPTRTGTEPATRQNALISPSSDSAAA
ncbi:hypothetical protein DIPPA_07740 [Diplonema papillatum]|nr:hypothetical protein DIPPA_07740 [Diplonema papillatum]